MIDNVHIAIKTCTVLSLHNLLESHKRRMKFSFIDIYRKSFNITLNKYVNVCAAVNILLLKLYSKKSCSFLRQPY